MTKPRQPQERSFLIPKPWLKPILEKQRSRLWLPIKIPGKAFGEPWDIETPPVLGQITSSHPKKGRFGVFVRRGVGGDFPETDLVASPVGFVGDTLWGKETTINVEDSGWLGPVFFESKAGRDALDWGHGDNEDRDHIEPFDIRLRSATQMTRDMARIFMKITGISVRRIQSVTDEDALKSGIYRIDPKRSFAGQKIGRRYSDDFESTLMPGVPSLDFKMDWIKLFGQECWDQNAWCWVVDFETQIRKPTGQGNRHG